MPKVLVHGNPETPAIWGALIAALRERGVDDVVTLSPPGFGAPVADGFPATQDAYRDWLVGELAALDAPIDLVGHDWGAGHVYGVLDARPDLLRSWAADCAGLLHPDYVWHDAAQLWQTPEVGEQSVAALVSGDPAGRAEGLSRLGLPLDVATKLTAAQDDAMARCILALYRSAAQPAMAELGRRLSGRALPPGLVLHPTEDPYAGDARMVAETAAALGAATLELDGLGHWWMFDGAATAADALAAHWKGAG